MKYIVTSTLSSVSLLGSVLTLAAPAFATEDLYISGGENQMYHMIALVLSLVVIWLAYKGMAKAKAATHSALSMIIVAAIALGATQVFEITTLGNLAGDASWSNIFSFIALGALALAAKQISGSK